MFKKPDMKQITSTKNIIITTISAVTSIFIAYLLLDFKTLEGLGMALILNALIYAGLHSITR